MILWERIADSKTIFILGGYLEDIKEKVFKINQGFSSRFPEIVKFAPMTPPVLTIGHSFIQVYVILQKPVQAHHPHSSAQAMS